VLREQMAFVAKRYDYDRAHVAEVDCAVPGIAAPLLEDGQVMYVVIDGIHRCVRAYQEGRPFQVHVLADADARRCVVTAPPGWIPSRGGPYGGLAAAAVRKPTVRPTVRERLSR
jgi:hypothetical protein